MCDKHLSRLQYLSWEFLFHLLLLTFDIWDVEQSQGISENPKFQKSLPFYSKNMVVIHLSTPNQLTLLSPHDIINYFRQDGFLTFLHLLPFLFSNFSFFHTEGTNFVGGMLIINAEMENIYNRVIYFTLLSFPRWLISVSPRFWMLVKENQLRLFAQE